MPVSMMSPPNVSQSVSQSTIAAQRLGSLKAFIQPEKVARLDCPGGPDLHCRIPERERVLQVIAAAERFSRAGEDLE